MNRRRSLLLSVATGAFAAGLHAAAAQTAPAQASATQAPAAPQTQIAQAPAAPSAQIGVEEIVVSGGKRPENVQDVSSSVVAFSADTLDQRNARTFDDIAKITPDVTITKTTQPANNSINIRGIGTYAFSIATQPSTAVVIDDIPVSIQAEAFAALNDISQVEVLRGPQSTLFGKAADAGVILITTPPPTDELTATASAMATNDREERGQFAISGPLAEGLDGRLAVGYDNYDGNVYNQATHSWEDGQRDFTLRGNFRWRPDADWTVTLEPWYWRSYGDCCNLVPYSVSPGLTSGKAPALLSAATILQGITPGPDNHTLSEVTNARNDVRDYGVALKIERNIWDGYTISSISSYDHYFLRDSQNTDVDDVNFALYGKPGTYPGGNSLNGGWFNVSQVTQEVKLTSPDSTDFKYVIGAFYSDTWSGRSFVRGSDSFGTYNGLLSLPTTASTAYSSYLAQAQIETAALYGQSSYQIFDGFDLVGGMRVHNESVSYQFDDRYNNVLYGSPQCSHKASDGFGPISTCNSDTPILGRIGFEYHVTPDIMGFVNYATGYKGLAYDLTSTMAGTGKPTAANPSGRPLTNAGPYTNVPTADVVAAAQPIAPETSEEWDVGIKSQWFDHRLLLNVTAFDESFSNFQAQTRDALLGVNQLLSIGKVTSEGVEIEATARPMQNLTLSANGAYDHTSMDSLSNGPCYPFQTVATGCSAASTQNLAREPLPNTPRLSATFAGNYAFDLAEDYTGFVGADYRWQSAVNFALNRDPDAYQQAYGIFDLYLGVEQEHWKATFFVNNLFNQHYATDKGVATNFNINRSKAPQLDAIYYTPGRDSDTYVGIKLSASY